MAILTCSDCGGPVSTSAAACPTCGRPMTASPTAAGPRCPHCGSDQVARARGLHGAVEVIVGFVLLLCFLLPGVIYYIVQEGKPYCAGCGRRVPRAAMAA